MAPDLRRDQRLRPKEAVLIACITVLLGLLVIEAALRLGVIRNEYRAHVAIEGERRHPRQRLLILGDSFVYKGGELSNALVQGLAPHGFQVLNLARSGTGPLHYLYELEDIGLGFRPDVVMVSYYVGNDLTDVQYRPHFRIERAGRGAKWKRAARLLFFYHFVTEFWDRAMPRYDWEAMRRIGIDEELIALAKENRRVNPGLLRAGVERPNYLLDNLLIDTDENRAAWDTVTRVLDRILQESRWVGAELVMVIMPQTLQVSDDHVAFYQRMKLRLDDRVRTSDRPQALLRDFCQARRIRCLDLLPVFRRRHDRLYLELDDHLNRGGNTVAADAITQFLLGTTPANFVN